MAKKAYKDFLNNIFNKIVKKMLYTLNTKLLIEKLSMSKINIIHLIRNAYIFSLFFNDIIKS